MDPRQLETPHRRSARATEIAHLWSRYQATPDERLHIELLRAADQFIRAEAGRMLASHRYLAEEACQEALLGVERRIATMEPPDHPAAYIRKILSNRIATLLQREAKRQTREQRYWTPEADSVDIDLTAVSQWHEFLESLREAVSDDEFWTLVLHYHFDFSYIEIGELLEKDPGAVRQIALRGRRKCRERMGRLEGRIPAWLTLPDPDSLIGWRELTSDSADGPRRPPAESEAVQHPQTPDRSIPADHHGPTGGSDPANEHGPGPADHHGPTEGSEPTNGPGRVGGGGSGSAGPEAWGRPAPGLRLEPEPRNPASSPGRRGRVMPRPRWEFPPGPGLDRRDIRERMVESIVYGLLFLRRWWLGIPTSVLPLVMIIAVPTVAQSRAADWSRPIPAPAALLAGQPERSGSRGAERGASGADQDGSEHTLLNVVNRIADVPAPVSARPVTADNTPMENDTPMETDAEGRSTAAPGQGRGNPPPTPTVPAPASPTISSGPAPASATTGAPVDTAPGFLSLGPAVSSGPTALGQTTPTQSASAQPAPTRNTAPSSSRSGTTAGRPRPTTTRPSTARPFTTVTSRRPVTTTTTPRSSIGATTTTARPTTVRQSTTTARPTTTVRIATTRRPTTNPPTTNPPTTNPPTTNPPTTNPPPTNPPTTRRPTTTSRPSTTAPPTTTAPPPTSDSPTTNPPTTAPPPTTGSATTDPTTAPSPTSNPPTSNQPTSNPPTTAEPTSSTEPATTEGTAATTTIEPTTTAPIETTQPSTGATRPSTPGPPPGATDT